MITRFVSHEYSTDLHTLGLYRIFYALFALGYVLPDYLWISGFPVSFLNPPMGIASFFTGFPPQIFFQGLNIALISCATLMLFGRWTTQVSILFSLLLFVGNSWSYSFGKINHDILFVLTPVLMALAGWGGAYSIDEKLGKGVSVRPWAISLLGLIVALAMFTAAVSKILGDWLNTETHSTLAHLIRNRYGAGREALLTDVALAIRSNVFWELLDFSTIMIEAAFLASVLNRKAFRITCALACFFHLGIALVMQITFTSNLVAYAAFFPWSSVMRLPYRAQEWLQSRSIWHLAFACTGMSVAYLTVGNPMKDYTVGIGTGLCIVSAMLATAFLVHQIGPQRWIQPRVRQTAGDVA
jgi:hypothetical protein